MHACKQSINQSIKLNYAFTTKVPSRHTHSFDSNSNSNSNSWDIEQALQLLDERPLLVADVGPVKLLERVDALPGDERVERVLFLPVAAVDGLVGAFDLDGDRGLAALHHGDLFVVALDGLAVRV